MKVCKSSSQEFTKWNITVSSERKISRKYWAVILHLGVQGGTDTAATNHRNCLNSREGSLKKRRNANEYFHYRLIVRSINCQKIVIHSNCWSLRGTPSNYLFVQPKDIHIGQKWLEQSNCGYKEHVYIEKQENTQCNWRILQWFPCRTVLYTDFHKGKLKFFEDRLIQLDKHTESAECKFILYNHHIAPPAKRCYLWVGSGAELDRLEE